jgi:hypothetical protein
MQEQDNDRLEQFFRKAAARADVSFNEDDWKKLEARLDAADVGTPASGNKIRNTATTIVGVLILISSAVWSPREAGKSQPEQLSGIELPQQDLEALAEPAAEDQNVPSAETTESLEDNMVPEAQPVDNETEIGPNITSGETGNAELQNQSTDKSEQVIGSTGAMAANMADATTATETASEIKGSTPDGGDLTEKAGEGDLQMGVYMQPLPGEKIDRELVRTLPASNEGYKQKAVVELPGAEEEKTREADATIEEEQASDQLKDVATPRLSLLLFYAPDFSGTSLGDYSAPGRAFGGLLHYHFLNRWSISAGVIKTQKQYTGNGEEYRPPTGYWKNYTNGIIPETIDGSCSILEFPMMVQYTMHNRGKNRWLVGAGVSSYLMESESYVYYFDQPNPGAKERWDSRGSSRFLFNMVNLSVGYERQVMPGLMLGLEPYVKIPVEEIGWTNLKLFSTGASITLRYTVLRKNNLAIPARSRPPD